MNEIIAVGSYKNKYFLWNDEAHICCKCLKNVSKFMILQTFQHKLFKKILQKTYCLSCWENVKTDFDGSAILIIREFPLPKNIIPVSPDILVPMPGDNAHSFGGPILANEEYEKDLKNGVKIINNCRQAFNPMQSIPVIDSNVEEHVQKRISQQDKVLKTDDGSKFLDDVKNAKPIKEITDLEVEK